ncbi:hypothetical protein [Stenotrophomonas sp. 24(2023)]|uniref:hypothetical protein n=1 Tax=Stenotrophomonas sp. 24(2023) TaxID=3068324 RepID=UPI0027E11F5D|nr:hypothetical protein [Stenotrophomonas sp. 24(2023)]WMJ69638.1 hypothetical protein Q9R17_00580 [Stenotrophomonas sp. 24(2023)]
MNNAPHPRRQQQFAPYHAPLLMAKARAHAATGEGLVALVLSVAASEAFLQDIYGFYQLCHEHEAACPNRQRRGILQRPAGNCFSPLHAYGEREKRIRDSIGENERGEHLDKYVVLHECLGSVADKGRAPFQSMNTVITIRNALVHPKGELLVRDQQHPGLRGYPRFIAQVKQLKLIGPDDEDSGISWMQRIDNERFGRWCVKSVAAMLALTLDLLPREGVSPLLVEAMGDPTSWS